MASKCGVCLDKDSKYKCPVCELRYCSLACYKTHKSTHENDNAGEEGPEKKLPTLRDRPGTTQRAPKVDFTNFEADKDFQRLLARYPLLKVQLQTIYGLTLEPGPDEARSWNRRPLPGFAPPSFIARGGRGRGRGTGRRGMNDRGGRGGYDNASEERERGPWTQAKGDKEAVGVLAKMRTGNVGGEDVAEGMKEFIQLCPTAYLTGHNSKGEAVVHSARPVEWETFDNNQMAMRVAYTTSFPPDLNNDADVAAHEDKLASGKLGLVTAGGTVLRYVDMAPEYECMMHRTQSVDYGIVLEGSVESILDSGERQLLQRGDVMVQRATMHAWRNPSKTEWSRMIFVLQDCKPLFVGGQRLGEDLGPGKDLLPPSGNDQ
ncbi:hypothetical protein BDY17DRAFT_356557 [Neohortaea acidophila]|uniref:HIT-type domain-containing protein n=1 Tax=Neohortaea acidophila TaxID=245834 RepID=A0A6A6PHZ9_9PEZI|nr:uncharacterized protein BDY17DRAFT_356557 [Neohortaea acidophila]KAF2479153.1 hypothetical protein BDY17DRAFT_356557 [Neohortaea acidophila]